MMAYKKGDIKGKHLVPKKQGRGTNQMAVGRNSQRRLTHDGRYAGTEYDSHQSSY